jgi:sugar phosphate isomerase/epimerase
MAQRIQIGVQLASLRQPFKKALHMAAHLGAESVEINARNELKPQDLSDTALRQIRKMLEDLNLRVSAVRFPTRRGYEVAQDLERRIEATQRVMRMAARLGADVVVNRMGDIPEHEQVSEWDRLIESVAVLGEFGHRMGTRLAAETGPDPVPDVVRLIDALPTGCLAVDFDPGNLIMHGFSPRDALYELGSLVAHVRARDAIHDAQRREGSEVAFGEGAVDFLELFAMLETHAFRGAVVVQRDHAGEDIGKILQAIQSLKQMRN